MVVKVYYWPFLGRGGAIIRMLAEANVEYEHVSDMSEMSKVCAVFGADGEGVGTLAPPVVVDDGDNNNNNMTISQSIAANMYIGTKYGFPAQDDFKAIQFMDDIKDLFENGIGKMNEDGQKLKTYLEGDDSSSSTKPSRFAIFASCLERNVKGPYFFGDKLSYVDFYFANLYAMYYGTTLSKLEVKTNVDVFGPYPKLKNIAEKIMNLNSAKTIKVPTHLERFEIKDDIVESYMK